ncbi:hypothetical protein [Paenibacillus amylolyticus]|uniref:hypothetical protein n=1 Tax=Paenibacillus amylolyticus TaxID=1451 RepID=UPI00201D380B|nr:hypothetical protein [Paenibacillus amylolyticus]MCL6663403.1 hypothetical protein [Paenibacillus amylolyticus]
MIKSTPYCNLITEGRNTMDLEDKAAIQKIFVKSKSRHEIRFAWYKKKNGNYHFQPRPLDLTESDLLSVFASALKNDVFSPEFIRDLKNML